MILPINRVHRDILEHIVGKAHIPFKIKAEPALGNRLSNAGKGGRFLRYHKHIGKLGKDSGIQLSEKGDSLKVFVPAVNIRYPLSRLAVIVEIEHGCYRIYAQPVHMILTQPKQRIRDKKALNLAPTDIKAACAPTLVLTSVLALIFV